MEYLDVITGHPAVLHTVSQEQKLNYYCQHSRVKFFISITGKKRANLRKNLKETRRYWRKTRKHKKWVIKEAIKGQAEASLKNLNRTREW